MRRIKDLITMASIGLGFLASVLGVVFGAYTKSIACSMLTVVIILIEVLDKVSGFIDSVSIRPMVPQDDEVRLTPEQAKVILKRKFSDPPSSRADGCKCEMSSETSACWRNRFTKQDEI